MSRAITDTSHAHAFDAESPCEYCRNQRPFEIPKRVVDACLKFDLVIFAGAGISTESSRVLPWTVYSEAASEVGAQPDSSFPAVMTALQQRLGRPDLLQLIKRRFD